MLSPPAGGGASLDDMQVLSQECGWLGTAEAGLRVHVDVGVGPGLAKRRGLRQGVG